MVHLTKIYTKTGDQGFTDLANRTRTFKSDPVICAVGDVDEANSAIGNTPYHNDLIDRIQNDLFDLGADLAGSGTVKITQERVDWLEDTIDTLNKHLSPLNSFVLPTGPLHHARTIVRRAERSVWALMTDNAQSTNPIIATYLNRLSDLLFVMARYYNVGSEKLWKPMEKNV